jgi:energy-coupling factor transport system ATP-binding protein
MDEAVSADRVIVMQGGEVVMDGTPREIFLEDNKLHEAGLTVPETTMLIQALRKDGFDIPLSALTTTECADAIYAAI